MCLPESQLNLRVRKIHNFKRIKNSFMPVQFKIKVTKEILELSKECGTHNDFDTIERIVQLRLP